MSTSFLERLRYLQGDASDAEFARRCGVKYTTMKNYLSGRNFPPLDVAGHIAASFHVSIDWLFGRDGTKVPSPTAGTTTLVDIAGEVVSLLGDRISKTYQAEHVKLPHAALVAEIARFYRELLERMEDSGDIDEARALMPWLENRIRKELREAASAPGTGKREAS